MKNPLKPTRTLAVGILAFASLTGGLQAAFTLNIAEVGSDVVASYSGSWDNYSVSTNSSFSLILLSSTAFYSFSGSQSRSNATLTVDSGPWLPSGSVAGTSRTGDDFGWSSTNIYAPVGYLQGQHISGTVTFAGQTLASMGLSAGSGSLSGDGNTVNYTITAIPEPASALLLGIASLALIPLRRRRS